MGFCELKGTGDEDELTQRCPVRGGGSQGHKGRRQTKLTAPVTRIRTEGSGEEVVGVVGMGGE